MKKRLMSQEFEKLNKALCGGWNGTFLVGGGGNSLKPSHSHDVHLFLRYLAAFTLAEGATHVAHWNNFRKIAFTLAEVLITLGIIGVVAALTLPTLIENHNKRVVETR